MKLNSTISPAEVQKFSSIAKEWWNPVGKFRLLHKMNPTRVKFMLDSLPSRQPSLMGLNVLDVGCGGGILSQPLARLGGNVLGVDASEENVRVAALKVSGDPWLRDLNLRFQATTTAGITFYLLH